MYETLRYVGDVLLQGLLTCLLMFLLNRWYERKTTLQKAKVAALFIALELDAHRAILATVITKKIFPTPDDDDFCFCCRAWEDFRKDLIPLLNYEDLRGLADYYASISLILSMTRHSEPYHKHEALVKTILNKAKCFCMLLGDLADASNARHTPQKGSRG